MNALAIFDKAGIPTHSTSSAVVHMREVYGCNVPGLLQLFKKVVDIEDVVIDFQSFADDKHLVRLTFNYMLLDLIDNTQGELDDMSIERAINRATAFLEANAYIRCEDSVLLADGSEAEVKKSKSGEKDNLARTIYLEERECEGFLPRDVILDRFMKEVDLTIGGARSYYYRYRDQYGDQSRNPPRKKKAKAPVIAAAPKKPKKTGPTRQEQAKKLYQAHPDLHGDRDGFRDLLMKELGMTTGGAQTYYYNSKRWYEAGGRV